MADKKSAQDKIIAFDTLFTTNHIQMLKIFITHLDVQMQKQLAIYIKFLELQYAISFSRQNPYQLCGCFEEDEEFDFSQICIEIMPYLTKEERAQADQFININKTMEMMQEYSKTMEMMKDIMPELSSFADIFAASSPAPDSSAHPEPGPGTDNQHAPSQNGSGDMMSTLLNMLTPEQKQMFELFGGNQ